MEVETDEGITGLGEMGGGGEPAESAFRGLKNYLARHDPFQLASMYWKTCNPGASLYKKKTQLPAALEFARMAIMGKKLGIRSCDLLGGELREEIPFVSYLFFRNTNEATGKGGEETADEIVRYAKELVTEHGFATHKLKAGVFHPEHEIAVFPHWQALFPAIDCASIQMPRGAWKKRSGSDNPLKILTMIILKILPGNSRECGG